jgi:hypothetical protein
MSADDFGNEDAEIKEEDCESVEEGTKDENNSPPTEMDDQQQVTQ